MPPRRTADQTLAYLGPNTVVGSTTAPATSLTVTATIGDVMALVWAMRGLTESTGEVAPGTWQRFLDIHLAGLRGPGPLSSTPSLSAGQLTELLPRP